jgi:hypothetical protein
MKTKIHKSEIAWLSQSANYKRVFLLGLSDMLKINIKRDSYDAQSHARLSRWDGKQWNLVSEIPYSKMSAVKDGTHIKPHSGNEVPFRDACKPDVEQLLKDAEFILDIEE